MVHGKNAEKSLNKCYCIIAIYSADEYFYLKEKGNNVDEKMMSNFKIKDFWAYTKTNGKNQ